MASRAASEPITVRAAREMIDDVDALAAAMDRSRNYVVVQAIEQYLATNTWQMQRIAAGITAADHGDVSPVEDVFDEIAAKHGWTR